MNKYKIAFFDIDGTLVDPATKQMSEKVFEALLSLQNKGVLVVIATGRCPVQLPDFGDFHPDVFLTFNGAYCFNQKESIYENAIGKEDVQIIISNAAKLNKPVAIASKNRIAANGHHEDLATYIGFSNVELEVAEDFEEMAKKSDIFQIMLGCQKEEYDSVIKDVEGAKIAAWWDRAIDVIPSCGGKGIGVSKILEYYSLKKEEAIAFGDGNNDIEMIEAVGTGVAMGNASERLKEAADVICDSVSNDGVYYYCLAEKLI